MESNFKGFGLVQVQKDETINTSFHVGFGSMPWIE